MSSEEADFQFAKSPSELTGDIVDFVMRDLRPVSVVDNVGFLHLLNVAESCSLSSHNRHSYMYKRYLDVKTRVKEELKQVEYMGLTTDMWT